MWKRLNQIPLPSKIASLVGVAILALSPVLCRFSLERTGPINLGISLVSDFPIDTKGGAYDGRGFYLDGIIHEIRGYKLDSSCRLFVQALVSEEFSGNIGFVGENPDVVNNEILSTYSHCL